MSAPEDPKEPSENPDAPDESDAATSVAPDPPATSGASETTSEGASLESPTWHHSLFDVKTARGRFAVTVAAGLAVVVLGPLVTSLPSIPVKVVHWTYLEVTGEKGRADLEDAVKKRPVWQHSPSLFRSSFAYATGSQGGELAETDGMSVEHHSISELAEKAAEYNGFPTELVGRVKSETSVATDILAPIGVEYLLTGAKGGPVAYVGVAPDEAPGFSAAAGSVVLVRGVVVASGVTRLIDGSSRSAIYVIGFGENELSTERVAETREGSLSALEKEARQEG